MPRFFSGSARLMPVRVPSPNVALIGLMMTLCVGAQVGASEVPHIGLYRLFETRIENDRTYENRFADVDLTATYTSPSGKIRDFWGFFDGDGRGGGHAGEGTVWRLRFMPDELGTWTYTYRWSDGAPGGRGAFVCAKDGLGKGVLRAYEKNPHWFAYNGTEPVWLKSYYETGHGVIGQDFDWVVEHVYRPFMEHGYNHLQVNWLLSLCCFRQSYLDGLLSQHDAMRVWAMAEEGRQYLVFASHGEPFALRLAEGIYADNVWIDAKTGCATRVESVSVRGQDGEQVPFTPPSRVTDWVLILRTGERAASGVGCN